MRLLLKATLIFAMSISSLIATAQTTLDSIYNRGKLIIGTTGNQAPYSMTSNSDSLVGFEIEIAQSLAKAMGVELELKVMAFDDLIPAVESGEIDAAMSGITITVERNREVVFVGPYSFTGKSILTTKSVLKKIQKNKAEDIGKLNLTALKGSTSEQFVKEEFKEANATYVENYDDAVNNVINGTSDALVADFPTCVVTSFKKRDKGLVYLKEPITREPIGMALGTTDVKLINLVDNYIDFLKTTGQIEYLEYKWYDQGAWIDQVKL